jgi:hypothetical protein
MTNLFGEYATNVLDNHVFVDEDASIVIPTIASSTFST